MRGLVIGIEGFRISSSSTAAQQHLLTVRGYKRWGTLSSAYMFLRTIYILILILKFSSLSILVILFIIP